MAKVEVYKSKVPINGHGLHDEARFNFDFILKFGAMSPLCRRIRCIFNSW